MKNVLSFLLTVWSQESGHVHVYCVKGIYFTSVFTICWLDFGTVPTCGIFCFSFNFRCEWIKISSIIQSSLPVKFYQPTSTIFWIKFEFHTILLNHYLEIKTQYYHKIKIELLPSLLTMPFFLPSQPIYNRYAFKETLK